MIFRCANFAGRFLRCEFPYLEFLRCEFPHLVLAAAPISQEAKQVKRMPPLRLCAQEGLCCDCVRRRFLRCDYTQENILDASAAIWCAGGPSVAIVCAGGFSVAIWCAGKYPTPHDVTEMPS